jgi:hypothetical protein
MPRSRVVPAAGEETGEQIALFQWVRLQQRVWPELGLLHHIPNGGHRTKTTAMKMQALGVKRGVLDLFLPVSRHGYHGLYIEMKSAAGKLTPEQEEFGQVVAGGGYAVFICRTFEQAKSVLMQYLFGDTPPVQGEWLH